MISMAIEITGKIVQASIVGEKNGPRPSKTPKNSSKELNFSRNLPESLLEGDLLGITRRIASPHEAGHYHVTINFATEPPYEGRIVQIFITPTENIAAEWIHAVAIMASEALQSGASVRSIASALGKVKNHSGGYFSQRTKKHYDSVVGEIADFLLEVHRTWKNRVTTTTTKEEKKSPSVSESFGVVSPLSPTALSPEERSSLRSGVKTLDKNLAQCPECGEMTLSRTGGCDLCISCNYSKCG